MARITKRIKHAWNAFSTQESEKRLISRGSSSGYAHRPDRVRIHLSSERSIISSIYTRLSIDSSAIKVRHVRLDEEKRYIEDMVSGLNDCLSVEANLDQSATMFFRDVALTLFGQGIAAIVPIETTLNPVGTGGYDIKNIRVGTVVDWFPEDVRLSVYNQRTGVREDITLPKSIVAIIENPFYSVMNEPNSTLQRLIRKLNLLDAVDEASSSGKLDIIIQLPYIIKSEARRKQAEQRREDIEFQLKGSQYGIAYTDGTEKITQLNRPAENSLLAQVTYLTEMLYGQLGLTEGIMNGTADEKTMLNYHNRTIKPVLKAIIEEVHRKFLTKTARTQGQAIDFFRDPFELVPMEQLAEIADKFTRNEIASSNDIRQAIGWKPSKDKKADELINSNMPRAKVLDEATEDTPPNKSETSSVGANSKNKE